LKRFNFDSSRLSEAGNTHSPIIKIMFWNLPSLILALFFLVIPSTGFTESVDTKIQEGISQYHEGEFKEAVDNFAYAHTDRPEDSRIAYNLGNAHYKEGKFQEALQAYSQSALDEKNPDILRKSIYNTGNTMVKLGKLEEAESAYKKVLSLDPSDMDAKYNLEYVRQQLEKKEEQESEKDQQKGEDEPSEKEKGENQEQNSEGDEQGENQPPPPENAESENKDPENSNQENANQPGEPTMEAEISKEKAEQMLEGLTEDLKNISRMQAGKTKSAYQGNDW
jgi:Ca-activated chloride channel family protein